MADAAFLIDPLSCVMLMVVTGVGFLIHLYSIGYMHGEEGFYRFFAYLNLFTFSMLLLVMGNNLLLMFVGWEGVGLCSYLLIGYYFQKKSACDAGKKAFVMNRVGDFGFLLGDLHPLLVSRQAPRHLDDPFTELPPCGKFPGGGSRHPDHPLLLPRSHRQIGADSRSTPGCPTPWKAPPRFPP